MGQGARGAERGWRDKFREARQEFERWRQGRKRGARIPDRLWRMAVELAREHGVWKAASELQLDLSAVKARLERAGEGRGGGEIGGFIEVSAREILSAPECVLEIESGDGASRLRIALKGVPTREIAALAREVWGTGRLSS